MTFKTKQKTGDNIRLYHTDHLGSTALVTDIDGEVTQHVAYIPYGEIFVEQRNGSWASPYLFNAKELDEETGLYYYGARYLDPTGTRWLSVDPLFEKYVGATPYNYCHENPITLIDPDGRGDFVNEEGETFANDGKADAKIYVLRADITKQDRERYKFYVTSKSGNKDNFKDDHWSYDGFVEIEGNSANRQSMVDIVSKDNGKGGESESNRREYGGHISEGKVIEDTPGPVAGPGTNGGSIFIDSKPGESTFHSHQSGEYKEKTESGTMVMQFVQEPSDVDIKTSTATDYVFGMRDKIIRVYDKTGIKARIPLKNFVKLPNNRKYKP